MIQSRDMCVSIRKTYDAVLQGLTVHPILAGFVTSLPVLYSLCYLIYDYTTPTAYTRYIIGSVWSLFGVMLLGWMLSVLSIWRIYPNLLSVGIFFYKCIGHWALVSFTILLFYGYSYLPTLLTSYISAGVIPMIVLLLFCADVMRAQRTRMFTDLETVRTAGLAATVVGTS